VNDSAGKVFDSYRSFLLLSEIATEEPLSQRELASRLGIALGLVNSYLKNLIAKGYVRVRNFPGNRYAYLLTPQGAAEKSRLAYQHLRYFTNLYLVARQDFSTLFAGFAGAGVPAVVFCGVDEVTEIAYLSLKTTPLRLVAVLDDDRAGESFFGMTILPLADLGRFPREQVVLTSLKKEEELRERLLHFGVQGGRLCCIGGPITSLQERVTS
jgi:DNA-binding MarR family transcriptional regulator